MAQLAIKGHPTRGKEVIQLLETLGGINSNNLKAISKSYFYYIKDAIINLEIAFTEDFKIYTLEEFEEKFPYKVGDKVYNIIHNEKQTITEVAWDFQEDEIVYQTNNNDYLFVNYLQPYEEENYCQVIGNNTSSNGVDTSASSINEETVETLNNKTNKAIFETNAQACDIMNDIIKKDMENKINIAELLKDCPKGMELDCTMYDNLYFNQIYDYDGCIYEIDCYTIVDEIRTTVNFTKFGTFNTHANSKCVIFPKGKTTWEGFQRPFKDGDILYVDCNDDENTDKQYKYIFILKKIIEGKIYCYCYISKANIHKCFEICFLTSIKYNPRLATEEEKEKLFDAIKANGYHWNEETKTLEKVLNKFDITTLKPFESKVLVRDINTDEWKGHFFSHYDNNSDRPYICIGVEWINEYKQCIPYEGNEHLLGTTNDCDDYYKTW